MMRKLLFAGIILLQSVAMAADATGKWTMSQDGFNGGPPHVTIFDLKVEGTTLTGTVTAPMGGRGSAAPAAIAITDGKVNGNNITFEVVRVFAGNSVTTRYEGTLSGDTLHIKQTLDVGNGRQTISVDAKRATP